MTEDDEARAPRPDAPDRIPAAGEIAGYIDDRWTKLFVVAAIVVFALIFANAIFLGQGGLLTTTPRPSPTPSATASPTVSPSPSATPSPTPTAPATATPTSTAAGTATASPTPTAAPTATGTYSP